MKINDDLRIYGVKRGRSIARRLTLSILLTVMLVSTVSIITGYYDAARKARIDLEGKVERNISAISSILEMPLWTYDEETISDVGELYAGNELIVKLRIIDSLDNQLFEYKAKDQEFSIIQSRNVIFKGKVAGKVEMALTSAKHREQLKQLLWSGVMTTLINLSVLIILTGVFLRLFLEKPLGLLSEIVSSYSSGRYSGSTEITMPYREFQPVVNVITSMGKKITSQIQELSQAEQKFRGIFENAVEGIFQVSEEGRFISVNPAMAKIFGYDSPSELTEIVESVAQQCFESKEEFKKLRKILDADSIITAYEICGLKKNGDRVWLSLTSRVIRYDDGSGYYYEGSVTDISDRKERLEAERRQKAADAASQAKTMFIARMSHEIRTPLNSVLGMTELLKETHLTDDQEEYIRLLQSSGEFLQSIINDILDFSKIEAQQLELEQIPFELENVIHDVEGLVFVRAAGKELEIASRIDPRIQPTLTGDPVRLKQILLNLAGNAVKFTKKGVVTIEAEKSDSPEIPDDCDDIVFRVSDTGIGIPESKLDTIFDSFTQVDTFVKRQFGGTGLGLSICKKLVELMGGELGVESTEGEGSVFFFTIRLKHSDSEIFPHVPLKTDQEIVLPPLKILLADDIAPNRTVVHKYLQKSPVTIMDVDNGQEAVELFTEEPFDLVLMDVEMPVMSGLDATRHIRNWENQNNATPTPLIILSAHAFGEQRKQCYEAGCNDLLIKPIRKNDLLSAISGAIKGEKRTGNGVQRRPESSGINETDSETVFIDTMFEDLLPDFFEYFNESLESMETALKEENYDDLYRLAHGLKGSSRNYEFFSLGDIFFEIEKAAADQNPEATGYHLMQAQYYLEHVQVELVDKG